MPDPNRNLGLAAAIGVILIWSGFIVVSRAGVLTTLTPYDVAGLRFAVAGAITLPFAWRWWPRNLPLGAQAALALTGPGILYSLMMYSGLEAASAAYAGVFSNGSLPLFTMLIVLAVTGIRPGRMQAAAVLVILAGGVLVAWRGLSQGGVETGLGIALFLAASLVLSVYTFGIRRWGLGPGQALAIVNIPNLVAFLPLWPFLPSGLAEATTAQVALQGLYQGLGPGFLAVILYAQSARHLGPTLTAGFAAAVPATAALLAIPVLSEVPSPTEMLGILIVTLGLGLLVRAR